MKSINHGDRFSFIWRLKQMIGGRSPDHSKANGECTRDDHKGLPFNVHSPISNY